MEDKIRNMSVITFYSKGVVVFDNATNEEVISIFPVEKLTESEKGSLDKIDTLDVKVPTEVGDVNITLKRSKSIKATWRSMGNYNRLTPPTISKGEFVDIYRVGNSDIFYWETCENNPTLRKEELVTYAWAIKDKIDEEETIDNMFYMTVDGKNKTFKFYMSDMYGSVTDYSLIFDALNGYIELIDGNGNFIKLETMDDLLKIFLNKELNIETGENIIVKNGKLISIENGEDIIIKNGNDLTIENGNNIKIENGNNIDISSGNNINVDATNITVTGSSKVSVSAPNLELEGTALVDIKGALINIKADGVVNIGGSAVNIK